MQTALIVVDMQNDFMPGGPLPTVDGDAKVPMINHLMERFPLVVATQDWHPEGHASFASSHEGKKPGDLIEWNGGKQILWPDHCVQESKGADFHPDLNLEGIDHVFRKGEDPEVDSYSGFFDNDHERATGLESWLRERDVGAVTVCGVATEYCVKYTALDARRLDFPTTLIVLACSGVEQESGDVEKALLEMKDAGVMTVEDRVEA